MKKLAGLAALWFTACGLSVKTVTVEPGQAMMSTKGASLVLHAVAKDEKGQPVQDVQFAWSSSNAGVAAVDATGKVTAMKSGTADIAAAAGDVKGEAHVKVQIPAQLAVMRHSATLACTGQTLQLHATGKDDTGNAINMPVAWVSSNPNVAAVDQHGMVRSMGAGTANVSARTGALASQAAITVAMPKFDKLEAKPRGPVKLKAGATAQLTAEALMGGKPVPGVLPVWTSSDAKVATVTPAGMVSAVKKGKAKITATAGEKKADVMVMVK